MLKDSTPLLIITSPVKVFVPVRVVTPEPAVMRRVTAEVVLSSPPLAPTLRPPVVPEIVKAFVPVTSRPPTVEPKARSKVARLSVWEAAGESTLSVPTVEDAVLSVWLALME